MKNNEFPLFGNLRTTLLTIFTQHGENVIIFSRAGTRVVRDPRRKGA